VNRFGALVLSLFASLLMAQADIVLGAPNDEDTLRAIPEAIVAAWSRGDGAGIAAVYADDGVLVAGDGTVTRGQSAIAHYHDQQFAAALKKTQLIVEVSKVRLMSPDVALLQTTGGILWPGQTEPAPGNLGIQSFVVIKELGTWKVALFQNTRILPKR
jgi:uncharacterized protein (TIGR02246 family)